jgi:carboxyl-terminal processing protease
MSLLDVPHPRRFSELAVLGVGLFAAAQVAYSASTGNSGKAVLRVAKDTAAESASIQAAVAPTPPQAAIRVGPGVYEEAFADLYEVLGREYPCFAIKGIDWKAVGKELLPRAKQVQTLSEFGLLCLELVARLEDSHAQLGRGTASPPVIPLPRFDPGFACLLDDRNKPVVYHVDRGGPAEQAGVRVGVTVLSIQGQPAEEALAAQMKQLSRYVGYSSDRYLRYHAAQFLPRQMQRGSPVALEVQDTEGQTHKFNLPATLDVRYLPRLPVPIPGIRDSGNVSWTVLPTGRDSRSPAKIGYIYVRRIQSDLLAQLDRAVGELQDARGLVIDVRGNSGGGFDAPRAHRNFALDDKAEPDRPRFRGPIALLIDSRCISAGEGWASWFVSTKRARLFGEATAGASSRKRTYTLKNGLFTVTFPVKAYTGFLDRPIERRGLEPHVPVRQNARDLAAGRDTVLEAARQYLLEQK